MDFMTWWFDSCPIASTFFTPFWTMIWAIWKDSALRFVAALAVFVLFGGVRFVRR